METRVASWRAGRECSPRQCWRWKQGQPRRRVPGLTVSRMACRALPKPALDQRLGRSQARGMMAGAWTVRRMPPRGLAGFSAPHSIAYRTRSATLPAARARPGACVLRRGGSIHPPCARKPWWLSGRVRSLSAAGHPVAMPRGRRQRGFQAGHSPYAQPRPRCSPGRDHARRCLGRARPVRRSPRRRGRP